ncbi:MAG: histidine phosphatase family protein [Candidatus Marsarchaeota archaeon]|nr:histidine phosphatase family protein [Candidatus Marsarchaeota archaeon]
MKVFLVRHGESVHNAMRAYSSIETPLTKSGVAQTKRVARRFAGVKVDRIFSSTCERAMQTAGIIEGKPFSQKL